MDYLGPHEALLENLLEFARGEIYRSSGEPRKSYMGQTVIDMSLIRMHFARGEISDRTFQSTDLTFFQDSARTKSHYNPHESAEEEKKSATEASAMVENKNGSSSAAVDYARLG